MHVAPHQQPFFAHPLAQLATASIAGIVAARFFALPLTVLLVLCALTSLLTVGCLRKQSECAATVFVTIAFMFAGASLASLQTISAASDQLKRLIDDGALANGEPHELTGVLERQPELAPASSYLTLRVEKLRSKGVERSVSGVVLLFASVQNKGQQAEYDGLELRYGARIRVMTALKRADNFRNPGVSTLTEYLERKGYDATGFVKSPLLIERLDDERVFLPLAWLYGWRQQLEQQINSHFAAETAGVLNAALIGNRYYLSHSAAERFRDGGTFHVLVISGLHISFIGGLVFLIARRISKKVGFQFLLSTTVLWSYALAVGAEASVVRAALMFTLVAFAPVVGRRGASLNALGAAALLLLVWRPSDLFDPSFQLTFLSVLAIVGIAWPLLQKFSAIGSWQPTRETPYPPSCAKWLRSFCECLFWSEQEWKKEMARSNYTYRLFKEPLAARFEQYRIQGLMRYAFGAIIVSVSVQITLLPLLIIYFHRLSLASIVLNIGVSLIMAALGAVAIAALVAAQVTSVLGAALSSVANGLNWAMVHSVDPFALWGVASIRLPEYSGWAGAIYALYYVPLVSLWFLLLSWNPLGAPPRPAPNGRGSRVAKCVAVAQLLALALIVLHPLSARRADGKLHIDFLDVGQGDAALVTMPDGTTIIVDGGGRPNFLDAGTEDLGAEAFERDTRSVGEAVVSEYLWWRGMDRVDYILATHADADHIDGLNAVARNFNVGAALVARVPRDDPEYAKFSTAVTSKGIPTLVLSAGDVLRFGGATVSVFWPPPSADPGAPSRNDDSVVMGLQFGETTILLTGDIERGAEAAILKQLDGEPDLRVDVVKVAHHGSKTSSTEAFVNATGSEYAIISVGQTSMFGHPHEEVVKRWKDVCAKVLTTGSNGMITVTSDGHKLEVTTFLGQSRLATK